MIKNLHIFRSLPFHADSRTLRNSYLFDIEGSVKFVCWGNSKDESKDSGFFLKRKKSALYMMTSYVIYSLYVCYYVLFKVKKGDICLFMDLETAFPAVFVAKIKKVFSIYDIVDPFCFVKPVMFKNFFKSLEEIVSNFSNLTFLPHNLRRYIYINELLRSKIVIVENVPVFDCYEIKNKKIVKNKMITLGFFGGMTDNRGIQNLLKLVQKNDNLVLKIAGCGPLEDVVRSAEKTCDRIKFLGAYKYDDLPKLIENVDIIVGLYYMSSILHKYACPNKYYEHLYFGKPLLTSTGIPFAGDIKKNNTGWIVGDDYEALVEWLLTFSWNDVNLFASNASNLWRETYSTYYKNKKNEILKCVNGYDES